MGLMGPTRVRVEVEVASEKRMRMQHLAAITWQISK